MSLGCNSSQILTRGVCVGRGKHINLSWGARHRAEIAHEPATRLYPKIHPIEVNMTEMIPSLGIAHIKHVAGGEIFYKHPCLVKTHHLVPKGIEQFRKVRLLVETTHIAMVSAQPRAQVVRPHKTASTAHLHISVRLRRTKPQATQLQGILIAATGFALTQMGINQ